MPSIQVRSRSPSARHPSRELQAVTLLRQATDINTLLADARATVVPTRAEGSTEGASSAEAEAFSRRVQGLLEAWHFPDVDRVTWSERHQDVVVSRRARSSYGKGKPAIMRAAFNPGLLRVLTDEERPSPGLVVIDSPLVVSLRGQAGRPRHGSCHGLPSATTPAFRPDARRSRR